MLHCITHAPFLASFSIVDRDVKRPKIKSDQLRPTQRNDNEFTGFARIPIRGRTVFAQPIINETTLLYGTVCFNNDYKHSGPNAEEFSYDDIIKYS